MLDKIVKLTRSVNRRVGKDVYYKHIITIPQKVLEELGWNEKTKLSMKTDRKKLIIEKE